MASSSTANGSSASSSSSFDSSGIQWEYEVFLSFRGEDTRNNFTDHLYTALNDRGIYTFRDDERLERGKEISSELLEAIERSRFSIIVLSKNYASSTWCLEELAKILECMATRKQKVFPVFYNVDPSDIRKQRGDFETAFHKHEEDYKDNLDRVHRWRSALTQVGNLSGWHLQESRSEAEFIKFIVNTISMSLKPTFSKVAEDLVGIKSSLEKINDLLESGLDDIRFIGICGMGGIGKTTIARVLYDSFSGDYQGSCFLADVREVSGKKGVVHLQEKLLSKVLNEKSLNICHPDEGINYIRRRLCHKRVFVVLDDVDQLKQLEKLAGEDNWFGYGSRIIVTTRDKHVLVGHKIFNSIYEVKGLEDCDALQLFHKKAFTEGQPTDDYVELSMQIVQYTNGLPLALEVLGSHLCGRSVKVWESGLNRLKTGPPKEILEILRISYDGLDETDKQIFLDIACFFIGKNKNRVVEILDGCYFGSSAFGMEALDDKSLVTIAYNKLGMHDLLQQMGWEIVREKHRDDRGQWSRLWLLEDIHHVLIENKGTQEVQGIMLDKYEHQITHLNGRSFSNMRNLRLLKIRNVELSEDIEYLSNELRFLKWPEYPSNSLPSNFRPVELFELNLCRSRIKYLWKDTKAFKKLKTIKLNYSHNLIETPDFTMVPNLEMLDLEGCTRLCKVHESVGGLKLLTKLNLKGCKNLVSFLSNVSGLKLLKILNLQGCSKLDKLPQNLGELECLEDLDIGGTAIRQVPPSFAQLTKLKTLSFRECKGQPARSWISSFLSLLLPRRHPNSCLLLPPLSGLCFLKTLDLSDCGLEGALPNDIGSLYSLKELKLSNNNFFSLPESIKELSKLKILCLENCQWLRSLPELPPNTIFVGAEDCRSLKDVSGVLRGGSSKNFALHLFNCLKLLGNQDHENSLAVMLLKQYLQQWVNRFSHQVHIPLPGSEIPKWFSCRSDGDSVAIELPPNWLNDEFMGIAMCGVYAPDPDDLNNGIKRMSFGISIMGNNYCFAFDIPSFTAVESDHLYLTFVSRVKFEHDYSYTITEDETGSDYVSPRSGIRYVSVSRSTCIHARFGYGSDSKVIKCGIRLVYKQDIEDFQELPAAEGSTFHQNHNCSLAEDFSGCSSQFPSSASSSSSDSSGIQCEYGVFLSFRGDDTRNNFTHLYTALNDSGIDTYFRDDERLERGKEISSKLLEAIERTRFSIIFLSKNYAFSTRCLEELAKILKCMDTKNQMVFPVFYKVDPSDIRTQRGDFETAFRKHEEDFKDNLDKVRRWRSALTQVGNLSGWHLHESRSKAELIKHIVYTISKSLKPTFSKVPEDLVGIKSKLEEINDLLESGLDDIRFIGICGIPGIGKTTIAKVLYKRFSGDYQGSCFLADVEKVSHQKGVVRLQEILLSRVLNGTSLNICNPNEGIYYIRWRLRRKRVFVVLDDVNGLEQLEMLAGKDNWFGSGSRIIITTRDKHVLISHGISSIYEVEGLEYYDALQLFHMKAFRQGQRTDDQVEQSKQIVRYTNGLPLALRVLGAHPSGRTVEEWKSELKRRPAERSELESIKHIAANSLKPSFSEVVKPSISEVVVDLFRDVIELIFDKIRSEYTDGVEEPDSEEEDSDEEPDSKEQDSDEEQIQKKKIRRQ